MHLNKLLVGALAATMILTSCQREGSAPATTDSETVTAAPAEPWDDFVNRFIEEHLEAHPAWAVSQGRHEYDGMLPDWSREGIERETARLQSARGQAMSYGDDVLSPLQQFQREYFVARLDHDLFWIEKARWPFRNPQYYLGWMSDSLSPSPYIALNYAPVEQRMAAFTKYLDNIPTAIEQIQANLEMPMPITWLQLGVDSFGGFATYFRDDVPQVWAAVEDEALQAAFAEANARAVAAMEAFAAWLESHRDTATDDFALGPELYRQMLWDTERVDISLEELEAIGRTDMARNLQDLRDACAEFAPGEDIRVCFAKMADRKPDVHPVEAAREQLEETKVFVIEQDLVSIPGTEEALVAEAPPYARSNFAYINIPGPWEKGQPSEYNIAPPNPAWPEDVQRDYIAGESDLLFTSIHEVWPGHFLNFLHANRAEWLFGRAFVGYAFGEGWAHYTEEMMVEAGLRGADPETRIGQISNALLRNARYLSSIGLHTQGWSVEDAKQFFMEEGFQSEGTAMQQAARGTYDPAYLNYNMAKLMIWQLREDWTASRGGRSAWREFHDTFLSFGGPPIPLVRQQMMGEPEPRAVFRGQQMKASEETTVGAVRQLNWAWDCTDGSYVVTSFENAGLWLFTGGESARLERVRTASGAKYEAEGLSFWNKGGEAVLDRGSVATDCKVNRQASMWEDAKLRGADFRGLGNEPGWHVELFSGQPSLLVTDYGQSRFYFEASDPQPLENTEGSVFTGVSQGTEIRVTLTPGPCQDSMADLEYETRVEVEVGGQALQGCGRALH